MRRTNDIWNINTTYRGNLSSTLVAIARRANDARPYRNTYKPFLLMELQMKNTKKFIVGIVIALLASFAFAATREENLYAYKFMDKYLEELIQKIPSEEIFLIELVRRVRQGHTECFNGTNEVVCAWRVKQQFEGILLLLEQK